MSNFLITCKKKFTLTFLFVLDATIVTQFPEGPIVVELENGTLQEPSFNCSVTLDNKTSFDGVFWMTETFSGDVKKITSQDDDNVKVIAHAFAKPLFPISFLVLATNHPCANFIPLCPFL